MKRIIFAVLALAACSRATPTPSTAPDDHAQAASQATAAEIAGATAQIGSLTIRDAWAAATPGAATVAAAYLTISNTGTEEDRLIGAASPRAARVETHEMAMDGPMMTMRKIDSVSIPAGGEAQLAPEGKHLMFFDITAPFADGETVPVTFTFEHAGQVMLELPVRVR